MYTSLDFAGGASLPKRRRQAPKSMDGFVVTEALPFNETDSESPCDTLKMQYFEGIDIIESSMNARFNQEGIHTLAQIEHLLISEVNGEGIDEDWASLDVFKQFHEPTLKAELLSLPTYLKLYNQDQSVPITKVTMMSSICDILNHKHSFKKLCPNIHNIMLFYNTIPLSSATAERTFSSMRRVKTWLRSRMCANTLTNSLFATIRNECFDLVDTEEIAREFVIRSSQRMNYFGQFEKK